MSKHHSIDYKLSAVKYYLDTNESLSEVCDIFNCSKASLARWVDKYENNNNLNRKKREYKSYKVKKKHVEYALKLIKDNKQITMKELSKKIKAKYNDFSVTPQWLGKVIRDNNLTKTN